MLVGKDFKEIRFEGVIHGWIYEDKKYLIRIDMCWDGCDVKVTHKDHHRRAVDSDHVGKSEPSFQDVDVAEALAIANAIIQEAKILNYSSAKNPLMDNGKISVTKKEA